MSPRYGSRSALRSMPAALSSRWAAVSVSPSRVRRVGQVEQLHRHVVDGGRVEPMGRPAAHVGRQRRQLVERQRLAADQP